MNEGNITSNFQATLFSGPRQRSL